MILVGLAGILIGDTIIFRAGATYGEALLQTRIGRHISGDKIERIIGLFERHGPKFVMLARFLPGVRAVTYFVAGTTRVPYWKFILYDGLAACLSAPGWVLLGHWAGKHRMLRKAWQYAKEVQIGVILVVLGIIALWIMVALIRRHLQKKRGPTLAALPGGRGAAVEQARRIAGKRTNEA